MIKYHGTPITPKEVFNLSMLNKNVLIPYTEKRDFARAVKICNNILIDNGAFTVWRKKIKIDWNDYYKWIEEIYCDISYFFIPDVIDGTEEENNDLIKLFIDKYLNIKEKSIPVWHINESFDRLINIMKEFDYIAIGSAGEYRDLGTKEWHDRMNDTMKILCDDKGVPKVKIHMLRCLNPDIFLRYPFHSGDSTNLAQNHSIYNSSKGSNDGWKIVLRNIERYDSPKKYIFKTYLKTGSLFF